MNGARPPACITPDSVSRRQHFKQILDKLPIADKIAFLRCLRILKGRGPSEPMPPFAVPPSREEMQARLDALPTEQRAAFLDLAARLTPPNGSYLHATCSPH